MEDLQRLLVKEGSRLLVLSGPGGIGKTRLALELGRHLEEEMEVSFISLGSVPTADNLLGALGQALGLADGEAPGFLTRLRQLCPERWLCILDSFEHLHSQAPLLTRMLGQIPRLQLLITSRTTLRVSGERVFLLGPLALPNEELKNAGGGPAMELFLERARSVRPNFRPLPAQTDTIVDICRALEGLPLALELAASRLELLTLEEIQARLAQKLSLLEAGPQDAAPRHRTMRATIDWSHELLEEEDRQLFRRLSLFSGGFRLEVLAQNALFGGAPPPPRGGGGGGRVNESPPPRGGGGRGNESPPPAAGLEGVSRLLRHNLLRRGENSTGTTRLYFMEVIREYAQEQLHLSGEEEAVRQAFCALLGDLAERARQDLGGPRQAQAFRELTEEHENLTACLAYLQIYDGDAMARLVGDLGWFWESSGQLAEGLRWAGQALELRPHVAPLQVAGTMARHQGDYALAERHYGGALELAPDDQTRALLLANLAETDYRRGLYQEASARYRQSLQLASGEAELAARIGLGRSLWASGHAGQASQILEDCLRIGHQQGWLRQAGWSHNSLGEVARSQHDWSPATAHFEAGAAIFEQLQDHGPRAILLQNLAFVQLAQERWEAAAVGLRLAFEHWFCCGSQHGLALSLMGLARLARHRKDGAGARQLARLAQRLWRELNCPLDPSDQAEQEALEAFGAGGRQDPELLTVDEQLTRRIRRLTAPALETDRSSSPSPLTGREQEVLQLLAEGLSNLEIGGRLHISRHTVTVHLRTIYDKLGVHSRSAATRWAMDQRL